jgi:glycosyltransferase involved in cell wall biosynthesis
VTERELDAYFFFVDTPRRRAALRSEPGSAERYALYGLDQLVARGLSVRHNLERVRPLPRGTRAFERVANRISNRIGNTGGDFGSALANLHEANTAAVVVATIDRLGLPLVLLKRVGLLRTRLLYVSVGLVERLRTIRRSRLRDLYLEAARRANAIVAYSEHEASTLARLLGGDRHSPRVHFVPFGVDVSYFRPADTEPAADVVSIGADPHRDVALLLRVAASRPARRFHLIAAGELRSSFASVPDNVTVETDVPFPLVRERLASARVVALPVRNNSYSGATTVLLQAMAMGKPVVVTRTDAIASGYHLDGGANCRLVPPGNDLAFTRALDDLLDDPATARAIGDAARRTAERHLSWNAYVDAMHGVLEACRD